MRRAGFLPLVSAHRRALPQAVSAGRQLRPGNEKASLEGMSEAFGSSAGADDQREAAREEERPQSLERGYAGHRRVRQTRSRKASHAEIEGRLLRALAEQSQEASLVQPCVDTGTAIANRVAGKVRRKKRGSIRRWSLMKVVAAGRG